MIWREHSTIRGQHAFLSPSKYSWINYDNDKLAESYMRAMAAQRGVEFYTTQNSAPCQRTTFSAI